MKVYIKTKKDNIHKVYISSTLMNKIRQYINVERPSKWLFPSPKLGKFKKERMHERQAHKIFQEYLRQAKLIGKKDNIPFHALRATCIKLALKNGWTVPQVAKLVDDKPRTIQEHYIIPTTNELRRTAEKNHCIIKERDVFYLYGVMVNCSYVYTQTIYPIL